MSSGFNTDVSHRERIFHIQTEDRGPSRPVIDTSVYQSGRVLLRKSLSYAEFTIRRNLRPSGCATAVAEHHRSVIENLRAGLLDREISEAVERAGREGGVRIQLLNPDSWLAAGSVSLDVQVFRQADGQPQSGAEVTATIEGALQEVRHKGHERRTRGRADIAFPLPPLGKGELALVISARAESGSDEIRFSMRSRTEDFASCDSSASLIGISHMIVTINGERARSARGVDGRRAARSPANGPRPRGDRAKS